MSVKDHHVEVLEIMNEQRSQTSSVAIDASTKHTPSQRIKEPEKCKECLCKVGQDEKNSKSSNSFERLIKEKEEQMRKDFQKEMSKEINYLKDRFDFVLQNEQIRASFMLCEAHRERQEKIFALQTQLECKNLAGLMYVLCSERRKCKLEKLKLVEDYTSYINTLQDILMDAQKLILSLSRGYKTAAKVDNEWREKMNVIMKEFQSFIYHFSGGTPESNQYFFDIPKLLKTETSIMDSTNDPCEEDEENVSEKVEEENIKEEKPWWERLDGDDVPFVMFGDMADFKPPQRREVLKNIKATKTAPKKWKEYVFNEMFLQSNCPNLDKIKDEYFRNISSTKWECQGMQTQDYNTTSGVSLMSRRATTQSIDVRGDMGSILKLITTNATHNSAKATLLGARDSMEIASTTKLREKYKYDHPNKVVINVGKKRVPQFEDAVDEEYDTSVSDTSKHPSEGTNYPMADEEDIKPSHSILSSLHRDSLKVIPKHKPDQDYKINYEKVCPVEKCKNIKMDSFVKSLPPYMKASPFVHFRQTYEQYETCSPEQLEILKQRIEEKKLKGAFKVLDDSPLAEWKASVEGIATQTSVGSITPPCTCRAPSPTPASSMQTVFDVKDLIPVKVALDEIKKTCFYDDHVQFDRFKVIGEDGGNNRKTEPKQNFKQAHYGEIRKILKTHPSLLEIFQANAHC